MWGNVVKSRIVVAVAEQESKETLDQRWKRFRT